MLFFFFFSITPTCLFILLLSRVYSVILCQCSLKLWGAPLDKLLSGCWNKLLCRLFRGKKIIRLAWLTAPHRNPSTRSPFMIYCQKQSTEQAPSFTECLHHRMQSLQILKVLSDSRSCCYSLPESVGKCLVCPGTDLLWKENRSFMAPYDCIAVKPTINH